jgi:hypothetical protein
MRQDDGVHSFTVSWTPLCRSLRYLASCQFRESEHALAHFTRFGTLVPRLIESRDGEVIGRTSREIRDRETGVAGLEGSGKGIRARSGADIHPIACQISFRVGIPRDGGARRP